MKKYVLPMLLMSSPVWATELYTGVGTTGFKLGIAQAITDQMAVRGEYNGLNYNRNFNTDDIDYSGKIKFSSAGLYLDYHPWKDNGFRVSAGALAGSNKVTADGKAKNGTFNINGTSYSAAGQWVSASASFPSVQPYLGLGYGFTPKRSGVGFFADLGVAYGKPDVKLDVSSGLLAQAGQANVNAEQQDLQDKLNKLRFYPVLNIGISYAF